MSVYDELTRGYEVPPVVKVEQTFPRPLCEDIDGAVRKELQDKGLLGRVKKGDRVAITGGSRGVANIDLVTRAVIDCLKSAGAEPFIIPTMGSHGGATAEGQVEVLESLGMTEKAMGVPIRSSMEVDQLGTTANGLPVCVDRIAATEADSIVVINRIKPHTSFRGPYESGLAKMIVIGLGKQIGAELCHSTGPANMSERIEDLANHMLAKTNIIFGVGTIENAYDETCRIVALPGEEIMEKEPALLKEAAENMPRIMIDRYDVLVVDEIGKNISGTGIDPNIVGRYTTETMKGEDWVQRIVVLGLTKETHGNANGIGLADVCTRRVFEQMDFEKTYPNALTSRIPLSVKIPMVMNNDRQAIKVGIKTCFDVDQQNPRVIRIKNTLHLDQIYISAALIPAARENPQIRFLEEEPRPFGFDKNGWISPF